MKKICIVTLTGNFNFGNRLQNYALDFYLKNLDNNEVSTIWLKEKNSLLFLNFFKKNLIYIFSFFSKKFLFKKKDLFRVKTFKKFSSLMNNIFLYEKDVEYLSKLNYDAVVIGSDQIWNPDVILGSNSLGVKKYDIPMISYAASFGWNKVPEKFLNLYSNLENYSFISVRELSGKDIINDMLPNKDVQVLIDPTMLLTSDEWDKVSLKPKMLKSEKFILNYFLGELSEYRRNEIERVAKENNCEIINILDKNCPFYECGPSEFLWLEKNAFLICTDSFHSSVFAILYNRPFIIFDREQEGMAKMNSRLDTLISKFNLKNRKFEGKITEENLNHDYSEAYKILEVERQKSKDFLERALDIKK